MRTGDRCKEVLFIGIEENEKLDALFWDLFNDDQINQDKVQSLYNGKYDPHLTICYLQEGMNETSEVKALIGKRLIDYEVVVELSDIEICEV